MTKCPHEFVNFAHKLADLSGVVHRRYFRTPVDFDFKPDGTPVTRVDRETEEIMRRALRKAYPGHGIVGEEFEAQHIDREFVWILDPLDGTEAFLAGLPLFGVMIALAWQGCFILGLIDQPILCERWVGADGQGTNFNGRRTSTRKCQSIDKAVLYASGPARDGNSEDAAITRLRRSCRYVGYGIECYTYGLLALGHIDVIADYGYEVFDFAPIDPVIRNAGGTLTDWQGSRLRLDSEGTVLACGDLKILPQVLRLLELPV